MVEFPLHFPNDKLQHGFIMNENVHLYVFYGFYRIRDCIIH